MHARRVAFLVVTAAAAACGRHEAKPASAAPNPRFLADVPRVPRSFPRDSSITAEVEQRAFVAPFTLDSVASFYRAVLPAAGWQIEGGTSDTGQITVYAQRRGQPLWVLVRHVGLGPRISEYTLTSAAASAPTAGPREATAPGR
ncbi:MAG TPA: hypothetical protein VMF70_13150 [Gemmatimonadales bacterium]|nr:hypothetical protein [Gemmatimonadales bacterium]